MASSSDSEEPTSRWEAVALIVGTVAALLIATEVGLRMMVKLPDPAVAYGLVHRPALPEKLDADSQPPFITNERGLYTARPGAPGINADGFRAPEWKDLEGTKDLVVFLGDGVVFGDGASSPEKSAAAQAATAERPVANFGIPGTGVRQYADVAEFYVPKLHPEFVFLFFNTGDDFELDPPVQPGYLRYHYADGRPIPAAAVDGQPLTLREAILAENAAALPPSALTRLVRRTVMGSWLADRLGAGGNAPHLAEVIDNIKRARAAAESAGAWFHVVLTPFPVGESGDVVARAAALLGEFSPLTVSGFEATDFSDPTAGTLNDSGHEKLGTFIKNQIIADSRGLPPILRPFRDGPPPTVDEFAEALGIDRERALSYLNALKDDVVKITFEPAVEGLSPGQNALVELLVRPKELETAIGTFNDYLDTHIHAATGLRYSMAIDEQISKRSSEFRDSLPEAMRPKFEELAARPLASVDTGYDPFQKRVTEILSRKDIPHDQFVEHYPWEQLVQTLKLKDEQLGPVRAIVNGVKSDLVEIYSKPGKDAPSPLDQLGAKLRAHASSSEMAATGTQASAGIEASSGKTYDALFAERRDARFRELAHALEPEQLIAYTRIPIDSILSIVTDDDPFNAALRKAALGDNPGDDDPNSFEHFRAALKLDDKQAEEVKRLLNALKDEVAKALNLKASASEPSPAEVFAANKAKGIGEAAKAMIDQAQRVKDPASGKTVAALLGEAEVKARRAIFAALTPEQMQLFEKLPAGSFADIATGYTAPGAPKLD